MYTNIYLGFELKIKYLQQNPLKKQWDFYQLTRKRSGGLRQENWLKEKKKRGGAVPAGCKRASYLWYAILVNNLPDIPVFLPGSLPEFEGSYKGIFIRQALRKYIPSWGGEREQCIRLSSEEQNFQNSLHVPPMLSRSIIIVPKNLLYLEA